MERREKVLVIGGAAVAGIIVAWLLAQSGSETNVTQPASVAASPGAGDTILPGATYPITFQGDTINNPARSAGYVPLFGFIGWSRQWF